MSQDIERANALVDVGAITAAEACERKVAHSTRNAARHAAKSTARKMGRVVYVYKCPFGDHWHVSKAKHGEDEK